MRVGWPGARAKTTPAMPAETAPRGVAALRQALKNAWPTLLAVLTALRLVVAGRTALSPDEAYYWIWAHAPAWSYPDHPGMVALWIRLGTLLAGDGSLGVRLLGPIAAAIGTIALARAAERLFPGQGAGWRVAILLNATLSLGVGSVIMTPDTPLLFFWTVTIWALARALTGSPAWWLAAGLAAGLALESKLTAILLLASVGLWLLATTEGRAWLRRPWPWTALALALLCFLPVLAWNMDHDWVTFLRQGGRVQAWQPTRAVQYLLELVLGQIGLATPLVAWLGGVGTILLVRRWRQPRAALLLALILLPALVFLQHALGDRVQGNWPAVLWPAALIGAALVPGRLWLSASALGYALTALIYIQAVAAPLKLPIKQDPTLLRLAGWHTLALQVGDVQAVGKLRFVVSDQYGIASELAQTLPKATTVLGIGGQWTQLNLPRADIAGQPGLLVQTERQQGDPDPTPWQSMQLIGPALRDRNGMVAERFRLWRVVAKPGVQLPQLPRPTRDPAQD
jgi:4-amino-4-deoxy-L-arabinose transferase-like glycosyltransferase